MSDIIPSKLVINSDALKGLSVLIIFWGDQNYNNKTFTFNAHYFSISTLAQCQISISLILSIVYDQCVVMGAA